MIVISLRNYSFSSVSKTTSSEKLTERSYFNIELSEFGSLHDNDTICG